MRDYHYNLKKRKVKIKKRPNIWALVGGVIARPTCDYDELNKKIKVLL
jgi:hypothetical protein